LQAEEWGFFMSESDPALKEITKLLAENPNLKIYVVGHADNVGGLDYNMKLSQESEYTLEEVQP
jgi:flagellar motor protein MotB